MSIILGTITGITGGYLLYRDFNKNNIKVKKERREFQRVFKQVIEGSYAKSENKINQEFEVLKYIPMHYGFDSVISKPFGLSLEEFHKHVPLLESALGAEIIAELSTSKKCIYGRIHFNDRDIAEKYAIRMQWYKIMMSDKGSFRNNLYETFYIKDVEETKFGYILTANIPIGIDINSLYEKESLIKTAFGSNLFITHNRESRTVSLKIIKKEIPDDMKFAPIKLKSSSELYIGKSFDYNDVIIDMKVFPNILISGINNSGKSFTMITALLNLLNYGSSDFKICLGQLSPKKDLKLFKNIKNCLYFATEDDDMLKMLKYLYGEMERRNALFSSDTDNYINTCDEWNKIHPDKKLPRIIVFIDEMLYICAMEGEDKEVAKYKKQCISMLVKLVCSSRSTNLNFIMGIQRPDRISLDPRIKSQCNARICFKQPNTACSLIVCDTTDAVNLKPQRECIVDLGNDRPLAKTLFISEDYMKKMVSKFENKNHKHLQLDKKGNIIQEDIIEKVIDVEFKEETPDTKILESKVNDKKTDTRSENQKKRHATYKRNKLNKEGENSANNKKN